MRMLALAAALILSACSASEGGGNAQEAAAGPREVAPILTGEEARDTRSFARPEVARVTHVALDLDADFEARRMAGTATLDIQAAPGARGDRPRFQGAGDRERHRRRRRGAAVCARRGRRARAASR